MEWLTENKIPLGKTIEWLVDLLNEHFAWLFDFISDVLGFTIEGLIDILQWCHPLALIALIAALAYWLQRSIPLVVAVILSLLFIVNLGYWEDTLETIALVVCATAFSMVAGVPVGIAAAHRPGLYTAIRPVLDLMQTIPTFVYLIPTLTLFGLGVVPGLISTVIFAIPAPIRLTYLGVSSVPKALVEAGESFGATKQQLLWKVEIPHAMPTIMAGLTQCIMLSLSMVVIAALVGADGLGKPVVRALNTVNISKGFEAGLAIVIIAILLDRFCRQRNKNGGGK
ncbi:choline ABC transporter permease subunit [Pelagibius sp. Alg239-R121]|uniref:choline ABC transporter permease subunit n=1 Tax=Pelagibius sp. Alg239-R121 TaxID=2993448 RepID=UPI0024A6105D|nr:choline ABC transporter permease subunit [Pelagibius sp. Alg239-R121]